MCCGVGTGSNSNSIKMYRDEETQGFWDDLIDRNICQC